MLEPAARLLAVGLYLSATKGIQLSEMADLRSWRSLPHLIAMSSFHLPPGSYELSLVKENLKSGKKRHTPWRVSWLRRRGAMPAIFFPFV